MLAPPLSLSPRVNLEHCPYYDRVKRNFHPTPELPHWGIFSLYPPLYCSPLQTQSMASIKLRYILLIHPPTVTVALPSHLYQHRQRLWHEFGKHFPRPVQTVVCLMIRLTNHYTSAHCQFYNPPRATCPSTTSGSAPT